MIIEALVSVVAALVGGIADLFGLFETPEWFTDLTDGVSWLGTRAAGLNNWIPLDAAVNAATFVAVVLGIALVIRLVRIVASFLTAGGGA